MICFFKKNTKGVEEENFFFLLLPELKIVTLKTRVNDIVIDKWEGEMKGGKEKPKLLIFDFKKNLLSLSFPSTPSPF